MRYPDELLLVAGRVVWSDPPEETLKRPRTFLTHLMNFGTESDVRTARKFFSDKDFQDALDHAPPGVFRRRLWEHWNMIYGRNPIPPLPKRFPESPDCEEVLWGRKQ